MLSKSEVKLYILNADVSEYAFFCVYVPMSGDKSVWVLLIVSPFYPEPHNIAPLFASINFIYKIITTA